MVALYIHQHGNLPIDPAEENAAPWGAVAASVVIFVILLRYFKKITESPNQIDGNSDTNASPTID